MLKRTMMICWGVAACAAAEPRIDEVGVAVASDACGDEITVTYRLTEADAITTLTLETNATGAAEGPWLPLAADALEEACGDVNRRVAADEGAVRTAVVRTKRPGEGLSVEAGRLRAVVQAWRLDTPPDWMVVNLAVPGTVRFYASADALPGGLADERYKTTYLPLRRIPAKGMTFRMGAPSTDVERTVSSEIAHLVSFTNDYYMAAYVLTEYQYAMIVGHSHPIANVALCPRGVRGRDYELSWNIVRGASGWPNAADPVEARRVGPDSVLGRLRTLVGWGCFDLPTEAQWEFACRAGTGTPRYNGATTAADLGRIANLGNGDVPQAVGMREPNPWGLYDMLGNSWELCLDWSATGGAYSDGAPVTEPDGPSGGSERVVRGGACNSAVSHCRASYRATAAPDKTLVRYGVRVCLPVGLDWMN